MKERNIREWRQQSIDSAWAPTGSYERPMAALTATEGETLGVWQTTKDTVTEAWASCGAFEWLALGYLAATSVLISVFSEHLAHPEKLLFAQAIVAAIVLSLCMVQGRYAAREKKVGPTFVAGWWHFWRHWYPHLFFLFCFEELAYLMTLATPNWQDAKLIAADHWLTGVYPSVWLEQFATPFRNDAMQFVYFTYFTYLLIVAGLLYFRKDWRAYWSVMTYSMAGYMIGYFIAMFFPIESPWFSMAGWWKEPLHGGPFTAMMGFIEHYGRVRGAAFPSAHVTGATAALWGAWKFRRWLFWTMVPFYIGMCASTVWGRYHYFVDVLAGMVTGTIGYVIGSWIMERSAAVPAGSETAA